eukprot:2062830-Rhodomonas_salina.2
MPLGVSLVIGNGYLSHPLSTAIVKKLHRRTLQCSTNWAAFTIAPQGCQLNRSFDGLLGGGGSDKNCRPGSRKCSSLSASSTPLSSGPVSSAAPQAGAHLQRPGGVYRRAVGRLCLQTTGVKSRAVE